MMKKMKMMMMKKKKKKIMKKMKKKKKKMMMMMIMMNKKVLFFAFMFVSFTKLTYLSRTVCIVIFTVRSCKYFHFLEQKSHCIKCDNSVDSATTPHRPTPPHTAPHQLSEEVTKTWRIICGQRVVGGCDT
jgi:heme/copper-type cytochrome/quinol oxidase subunit 3